MLVVEHQDFRPAADLPVVAEILRRAGDVPAGLPDPDAIRAAGLVRRPVEQVPVVEAAGVAPFDPGAVGAGVPIPLARQVQAAVGAELPRAIGAVTDARAGQAAPAVVGESLRLVIPGDFAQHRRDMLPEITAVDARHIQAAGAVRPALGVHREPIRVGLVRRVVRAVRVHAREDRDPVGVRGLAQLAEQIAVAQEPGAALEGNLRRIERHDAAGVGHDALRAGALPLLAPPRDIIAGRIELRDVGQHPARRPPVPRARGGRGGGRRGPFLPGQAQVPRAGDRRGDHGRLL